MILRSGARSRFILIVAGTIMMFASGLASAQSTPSPQSAQEAAFQETCAVCHNNPATRAPARPRLAARDVARLIVEALTNGIMKAQGSDLSPEQRVSLAEYLTGQKLGAQAPMAGRCSETRVFSRNGPSFNGWGANAENWRYQADPGVSATQLQRLDVKWAFGIPGVVAMFGPPTIVGDRVFIVYALDAATGEMVWKVTAVDGPAMQVTGAPALFEGRLYVPISGGDDSAAIDPKYECCKGRGAIVALDAATGAIIWKTYTIPEARPLGRNSVGAQLWGPSGVSVWSSPTIDAKRRMLYAGTGDNHSAPATDSSDAVLAVSLDSGEIMWVRQLLAGDMRNADCLAVDKANCPEPHGPDFDLGASANLITLPNGRGAC
jgi:polyvinyl alcohol dehydrogenase (cytochrome)